MKKKATLLLGAHMSINGGLNMAIERGASIGCTAIQIFTKSNRQWYAKPLVKDDINKFHETWKNLSIKSVIAHASYLINIGSPNNELAEKSVAALTEELNRCSNLSIPYLVLHPGSHSNTDVDQCLANISANLDKAIIASNNAVLILLETMAGQGTSIGYTFEQIGRIIEGSFYKNKIGVCFDTCHAFAAGYDFRTQETYDSMWSTFDQIIGINKLKAIHCNDSKADLGSRVDRHANIGEGKIGLEGFRLLFKDSRFVNIPKILETPKKSLEDDTQNMATIMSLTQDNTVGKLL